MDTVETEVEGELYKVYGDDCVLSVRITEDELCTLTIETDHSFNVIPGIEKLALVQLLDKIVQGEADDVEFF